jgi:NADH-quinone oxidoreductase subunit L
MFHLIPRLLKALLFSAPAASSAMSGQQDIRKMGGLWPKVRTTAATFWMATLAIAGAPLFSGFFSKDEILWQTFASPSLPTADKLALWLLGLITATMTSFYMFRLVFLTFHGEGRYTPETAKHIHESPSTMTLPLVILAVLSVVGGWVILPPCEALHIPNYIEHF